MKRNFSEPQNPFDAKIARASEAFEHWNRINAKESAHFFNLWCHYTQKGMEWENAMALVRLEILDARYTYGRKGS